MEPAAVAEKILQSSLWQYVEVFQALSQIGIKKYAAHALCSVTAVSVRLHAAGCVCVHALAHVLQNCVYTQCHK